MDWQIYNKLSNKQKEEYNYTFGNLVMPKIPIGYIVMFCLLFIVTSAMYLLMIEKVIDVNNSITNAYVIVIQLSALLFLVCAGEYVINWLYYGYQIRQRYKWLKERIKNVKWYQIIR